MYISVCVRWFLISFYEGKRILLVRSKIHFPSILTPQVVRRDQNPEASHFWLPLNVLAGSITLIITTFTPFCQTSSIITAAVALDNTAHFYPTNSTTWLLPLTSALPTELVIDGTGLTRNVIGHIWRPSPSPQRKSLFTSDLRSGFCFSHIHHHGCSGQTALSIHQVVRLSTAHNNDKSPSLLGERLWCTHSDPDYKHFSEHCWCSNNFFFFLCCCFSCHQARHQHNQHHKIFSSACYQSWLGSCPSHLRKEA